ncbi:MAG: N-6 DNA methylase [Nannocystaceae bacterium]
MREALRPAARQAMALARRHAAAARAHDLLGALHQALLTPQARHELGEFYTPPWLASAVAGAIDVDGPILDPTCGAGALLRATIAAVLARHADRPPRERAAIACARVRGLDIHPLAVALARASVALELCELVEEGDALALPVAQGDVLGAPPTERLAALVGNPPWLAFRQLPAATRARVSELADGYGLPGGKLRTQLELAVVVLLRACDVYLKTGGKLAFVAPRSLLSGDQHDVIRRALHRAPCRIDALWDLREVTPLFPLPGCVVLATRAAPGPARARLPARALAGRVDDDGGGLTTRRLEYRLHLLGARSCWHPGAPATGRAAASPYREGFRQGATLVPRNYYFVTIAGGDAALVRVVTDERQARAARAPYRDEQLAGELERVYLHRAILSRHLLPYRVLAPAWAALPILSEGTCYRVLDDAALVARGDHGMARWMTEVEARFRGHQRGRRALTARARLDYNQELRRQRPDARHLVLYNTSGTHLAAALLSIADGDRPPIVDAKCYWYAPDSRAEGDYLAAILNAAPVDAAIKPFQSVGLRGERDIHKKPLELPIPRFDVDDARHQEIAARGRELAARVANWELSEGQLGAVRRRLRAAIAAPQAALDALIAALITDR